MRQNYYNISDYERSIASYCHLMEMAIIEKDLEVIPVLIEKIIVTNKSYRANLPHVRISLVYALEGSILLNKESGKLRVIELLWKLERLHKRYNSLIGPTPRVKAKYYASRGKKRKAAGLLELSLSNLKNSQYRREYALTLKYAAEIFTDKAEEYISEADLILFNLGLKK